MCLYCHKRIIEVNKISHKFKNYSVLLLTSLYLLKIHIHKSNFCVQNTDNTDSCVAEVSKNGLKLTQLSPFERT